MLLSPMGKSIVFLDKHTNYIFGNLVLTLITTLASLYILLNYIFFPVLEFSNLLAAIVFTMIFYLLFFSILKSFRLVYLIYSDFRTIAIPIFARKFQTRRNYPKIKIAISTKL